MEKQEFGIGKLRGNLFWLVLCQCIWQFTTNIPRPYLPLYIEELGGTPSDIGLVNSVSAIAGLFLYPIGGYVADKSGRVKLISIATFLYAFSFLPFAFAPQWEWLVFASFFQQLVLFYSPILTVVMADSMIAGKRGEGFALAISLPAAIGVVSPFIGGFLVDAWGIIPAMRLIYNIGFGAGILVASIRMFTLKETLDPSRIEKINFRNFPKLIRDSYLSLVETIKWMPNLIKMLAIIQILQVFFNGVSGAFWIVYATSLIGISATSWGVTSAIQGGTRLALSQWSGKFLDKYGRRKLLIPFLAIVPLYPLIFLYFIKDFTGLSLMVFLMAIGNAFLMPGFQSLIADAVPRERRGRVTSAIGAGHFFIDIRSMGGGGGMLLFAPMALAQLLGGISYEIDPTLPFKIMSAGMTIVAVWAFFKIKDPDRLYE
ncbi:MFS transporter [Candidatus Bathyarchaeota archaeon]|nr:MFS transporter [Candidatus Bathyarchaeota archaeon]MBS7631573.1 MFS transporter [Candidatus Bathyarchaeota archaeon]